MSFTHQGHHIPWQVLAEVYVEEAEYSRSLGGGKLGSSRLKVRDDWPEDRVLKAVRHVARRLAWAIEEFGRTELHKYRQRLPSNSSNLLLYEERHFDDLLVAGKYQQVTYWRKRQEDGFGFDNDLGDMVTRLLHRGMFESLLLLVDEGIRFDKMAIKLYINAYNYRFSINWVMKLYIALNLGVAMDSFKVGAPHNTWLAHLRDVRQEALYRGDPYTTIFKQLESNPSPHLIINSKLSNLFRFLYQYHALMVECDMHVNWEYEALFSMPIFTRATCEYTNTLPNPIYSCLA